jgi:hypothetical protein
MANANRGIGTGSRTKPQVRHLSRGCPERIDHHDAGASGLRALQRRPLDGIRDGGISAHDQSASRLVDVLAAGHVQAGHFVRSGAAAATKVLIDHPVGRADRSHQQSHHQSAAEECPAGRANDRGWTILPPNLGKTVCHFRKGLVPADRLKGTGTALLRPAKRRFQTPVVVGPLLRSADSLDTERALRARVSRVRGNLCDLPIVNRQD